MSSDLPSQIPEPGARLLCHAGDVLEMRLRLERPRPGEAWLRTNLGRATIGRRERIAHADHERPPMAGDWRDLPMESASEGEFVVRAPLTEVGRFEAKACFLPRGSRKPVWPEGENLIIKVAPAHTVCANTLYTVFTRQFGGAPRAVRSAPRSVRALEERGFSVIPPSGTFRDVARALDVIIGRMGFRVLQLLPIHPTPTTYARMGRYGSPFAGLDFLAVDPALAEFDRRSTPLDQFRELIDAVHARSARLFMDIPANHTGWASTLQTHHPEWFRRAPDGAFRSPGAWGVTWEDLAELDYRHAGLRSHMAEVFLFWCAQGVDGFRCDAGYMIPVETWTYIVDRTREAYPDTIFLLEGLGGKFSVTERLLADANLDWAYSEIFQTEDRAAFERYLPKAMDLSRCAGPLVHYAETHDNDRLAARGEVYARMRTALAAMLSHTGGFGITNGVEWFADVKIDVHGAPPLRWGARRNQLGWLRRLNALLSEHPAFASDVLPRLVTRGEGNVLAVLRASSECRVLVLANLDDQGRQTVHWPQALFDASRPVDLLEGIDCVPRRHGDACSLDLAPGKVLCLSATEGDMRRLRSSLGKRSATTAPASVERQRRRLAALRLRLWLSGEETLGTEMPSADELADALSRDPEAFCRLFVLPPRPLPLTRWHWPEDMRRCVMLPPRHVLFIRDEAAFHVRLTSDETATVVGEAWSLSAGDGHMAFLPPVPVPSQRQVNYTLELERFAAAGTERIRAPLMALPSGDAGTLRCRFSGVEVRRDGLSALLTNGRGAMAQVRARWGEIRSQYDALLAANLHPGVPVDRTVVLTRCRGWVVNRGYSQAVDADSLAWFEADPGGTRATWHFRMPVGMGRWIPLTLSLRMPRGRNRVVLNITREYPSGTKDADAELDDNAVTVILRPDIEWRSFHSKTKAYTGAERRWPAAVTSESNGFSFCPEGDTLRVTADVGRFHLEPEWQYNVPHPEDAERGLDASSDLFSPGFFSVDLSVGQRVHLSADLAEKVEPPTEAATVQSLPRRFSLPDGLARGLDAYIVRRDALHTVIAGYPWFLDWGRDTLIVLRGLIADGRTSLALDILREFGRFERQGTLPNMIRGEDDANRDTSDAPLWFMRAAADLIKVTGPAAVLEADCGGRPLSDVAASILRHYRNGTPNGIAADHDSGLIYSPAHFTWMDTNHPAGTPRAGYPVEIQALWLEALRFGAEHLESGNIRPSDVEQVEDAFERLFCASDWPHLCDCRLAETGVSAAQAHPDDALRCNAVLALALGAVRDKDRARRALAACEPLLVPGAIRSLADRPVRTPLSICRDGVMLGDPHRPYRGRYLGDEDMLRKPAYHNGTAWSWVFPSYVEAFWRLYGVDGRETALALLGSASTLVNGGCVGHIPEIVDGDAPHTLRGCGAQAWGVSEFIRVWKCVSEPTPP